MPQPLGPHHDEHVAASILVNQRTYRTLGYRTLGEYVAGELGARGRPCIFAAADRLRREAVHGDFMRAKVLIKVRTRSICPRIRALWLADAGSMRQFKQLRASKLAMWAKMRPAKHRHAPFMPCSQRCKYHGTPYSTE